MKRIKLLLSMISFFLLGGIKAQMCMPNVAPFMDDIELHSASFNIDTTECWSATAATNYDWNIDAAGSTPTGGTGPSGANSGTNYFYVESSGASVGVVAELTSPEIDISGLTIPSVQFSYHMFGANTGSLFTEVVSGGTVTVIDVINGQQQTATGDAWLPRVLDLSAFTDTIQIRFRAVSGGTNSGDISIDDFSVMNGPTCFAPLPLPTLNITSNSADLEWNSNSSITEWQIEWGGAGFTPGTGAIINNVTTNPFTLTGLSGITSYDFYVRAVCAPGDTSVFSTVSSFTTPCSVFPAPFMDDVEAHAASTSFTASLCWAASSPNAYDWNIDANGSTPTANTGPSGASSGTRYFYVESTSGSAGDEAELLSPSIDLSTLTTPRLTFDYHMFGANTGSIITEVVSGGAVVLADTLAGQQQTFATDAWLTRNIDLSSISGIIEVRFRAVKAGTNTGDMALDDIVVEETPSCLLPTFATTFSVTGTDAFLTWMDNNGASEWEIEWGNSGFAPGTGTTMIVTNDTTMITGLTPVTNYDFYVRAICTVGDTSAISTVHSFVTPCLTFPTPFMDNVETHTPTTILSFSECWSTTSASNYDWNIDGAGSTPSGATGPAGAFSGTNYFYVESSSGSAGVDEAILTSPVLDISTLTVPILEFRYHMFGDDIGTLYTEVISGGITTIIDSLDGEQQTSETDSWILRSLNLSAFSGTIQVQFRALSAGTLNGDISLDDINVYEEPTCREPLSLAIVNLFSDSAIVSWVDTTGSTEWVIEWGAAGFTAGTGTIINNVTTNPYTITGLLGDTDYEFYVRTVCAVGDTSFAIGPLAFLTLCSPFIAPYMDDVEAHNTTLALAISECWTATATSNYDWNIDGAGSTPTANTGPAGAFSGTNYFYVEGSSGSAGVDEAFLTSPVIDISALTVPLVEFRYHMFGDDIGTLYTEVISGGVTTIIDSLVGQQQTAETDNWAFRSLNLSAFSGTIQIQFRALSAGTLNGDISLDDISVVEQPTCREPMDLATVSIFPDSAIVSWVDTTGSTEWIIEWGGAGFTPGTGAIINNVTTNPFTITGLLGNTNYEFYVTTVCAIGDTSFAAGPLAFLTPCSSFLAPYLDDFELHPTATTISLSECWTATAATAFDWNVDGAGSTPSTGTGPTNGAFSGSNYFYVEASSGSLGTEAILTSPFINVTPLTLPILSYYYHMFGADMGNLIVQGSMNGGPFVDLDSLNGQQQTLGTDPWERRFVSLAPLAGASTIQIRFIAVRGSSFTSDMSIDDVAIIEAPNCLPPNSLGLASILPSSADVFWSEIGTATLWDIQWGGAGFTLGTGALINNVTNDTNTISGLLPETSYDFYVRSDCSPDSSTWSGPFNFTTPCAAFMAPITDSVETHTPGTSLTESECWEFISTSGYDWNIDGNGSTPSNNTGPSGAFSGNNYFYIETAGSIGDEALLISPVIDVSALTNPALEFYYHMFGANMGDLIVEVSSNGGPYTQVDAIFGEQNTTTTDPWLLRFVSLQQFGPLVQVRFRAINRGSVTGDMSLDDLSVVEAPACPQPSTLTQNVITADSVVVSWVEGAAATNWIVEYGLTGFTPGTGNTIITTSNPLSINGLMQNSDYSYFVRSICAPGDTSASSSLSAFQTPCATFNAPYLEDVENHVAPNTAFAESECWSASATSPYEWEINAGNLASIGTGPSAAFSGSNYFMTEASSGGVNDTAILNSPMINISSLTNPILDFHYHMFGEDMGDLFVEVSANGGPFTQVDAILGEQQLADTDPWERRIINLSAFSGDIQVRFISVRGTSFESDMALDNINVIEMPSCPEVSMLSFSNVTTDEALLSWVDNASAMQWEIQWGESGFPIGTGNTTIANSVPFLLTGLSPATNYDFYVRPICSTTDTGLYTGPRVFITECGPLMAPWIDDLEAHSAVFNLDTSICWSASATTANYDWNIDGAGGTPTALTGPSGAFSGTNYFYIEVGTGNIGDTATLVSPLIDVTNIVPELLYRYHMFGAGIGDLFVEVSSNGGPFVLVDSITGGQVQTASSDSFNLRQVNIAQFTGIIQVRFTAVRTNTLFTGDISLDDIEIRQSLTSTCVAPSALTVTNTTMTTVDLSWTDNAGATIWVVEWGTPGFTPGTGTGAALPSNVGGSPNFTVPNLLPNTAYDFYVSAICTFTDSSVAVMGTFMTDSVDCSVFIADLGADTIVCSNDFLVLDPNVIGTNLEYIWSIPNTSPTLIVDTANLTLGANTITVTVNDTVAGCSTTDDIIITLLDSTVSACITGINENGNGIELSIYPNPNNGIFTLNVNTLEANELEVKVVNIRGQVVFSKSNFERLTNVNQEIDLEDQSKGIYFVTVTTDKGTTTNKIVVQ